MKRETDLIAERYIRRKQAGLDERYSMLNCSVWLEKQGRQRALISLLKKYTDKRLNQIKVLEIGCGNGGNLLELIRLGFAPENLVGNELLPERAKSARKNLPCACKVEVGDAVNLAANEPTYDIVYQSTVFTSILDRQIQQDLASKIWSLVRPGGCVIWYDFIYSNPVNPDVRGIPVKTVRQLFPQGILDIRRITLAPPISRRVCHIHSSMYHIFHALPFLRTHILCWIQKAK